VQDSDVAHGTLPTGFQFGAYVIGSCIGQGGMARIYRAEHRVLHKPVALKVMEGSLLERPDGHPRFLREGRAAAAVKHPNVVDITDVGVWQGRPYLVMELLEGEDLEQYLSRHKPLPEHDVARIMVPVIAGLATAHAAGVIHRDLKPSNVFLARGPDGEIIPKLLDFGISKLANALRTLDPASTPLGELMGSPMYMSPEAVRGARDLAPAADQYSLGVMLYECVTGRPPFYSDSLLGVLEAVAHGQFDSPRRYRPDLSTVIEVAISRAMSRDPSDRFPSVRELGRALCEAADERTRLLWTPSFGLRDLPYHRNTANLGSSPVRTGSPLSATVTRRPQRLPIWQLALSALALVMLALASVAYWRMPTAPYAEVPFGVAAAARAAASSAAVSSAAVPPASAPGGASLPGSSGVAPSAGREAPPVADRRNDKLADDQRVAVRTSSLRPAASPASKTPPARAVAGAHSADSSSAGWSPAANSPAANSPAANKVTQPRASNGAGRPPVATADEHRATRYAPASAEPSDDDEVVFPVRAPTPSRPTPVLGANQSPILD
jgi:eukaryotic-like serine/threonine-protein kinase